ncbi:MAG: RraA family protein [Kordiimonadaceae bacterium]|jgi:4-hydroxy-4-methyl-2-oxoglutarate aldolase|nr:RraA family protein [Kordiimonadaceae bacterium]MBT6032478.1 RraA family protein [Kordiimonadaceae bacterium]
MTDDLLNRLKAIDSCAVSDAMDSLGLPGEVTGINNQTTKDKIIGRTLTVKLVAGKPEGGSVKHLCSGAIEMGAKGNVIVIEQRTGIDAAGWGGVLSNAAQHNGIEGVIVEGPARDIDEAAGLGFTVYARGHTARTARARIYEQSYNTEITVGDVKVNEGDVVIADGSAVVFIPAGRAEEVIKIAERIVSKEQLMTEAVRSGTPVGTVMGSNYENMLNEMGK